MTTLIGYARVSSDDQDVALQTDALTAAGCLKVFTDTASGSLAHRMLDRLRTGDVVVVWRLDRLGRSLKNLIPLVDELADRRVGFRSLSESIDTTTANGKLFFSVMGALARVRA
jgi:DNA invertase Pin-like site-specific DNA recombinase